MDKVFTDEVMDLFDIDSDVVKVYGYIDTVDTATALDISENLHISRTQIYRYLDKLLELDLIIKVGSLYKSLPLESLLPNLLKKQLIIEQTILEIKKASKY